VRQWQAFLITYYVHINVWALIRTIQLYANGVGFIFQRRYTYGHKNSPSCVLRRVPIHVLFLFTVNYFSGSVEVRKHTLLIIRTCHSQGPTVRHSRCVRHKLMNMAEIANL